MGICYSLYQNQQLIKHEIDVPFFNFDGQIHTVKVVDVYDGDTCQIMMKFNNSYYKFKVRALGYDSPEMKPPMNVENRLKIKEKAIDARNYLISRITDLENPFSLNKDQIKEKIKTNKKLIKIRCYDYDKYGRILVEFIVNGININKEMIEKNYGYPYDGGTKRK